jgi:hypothetical protein
MTTELPRDVQLAQRLRSCVESMIAEDVAEELDPIGRRSSSYPYLALARRVGADYGDVLWFADYLTSAQEPASSDPRLRRALENLTERQREEIATRADQLGALRRRAQPDGGRQ